MPKPNIIAAAVLLGGLATSTAATANDIWQFTVTSDQNGSYQGCNGLSNGLASVPCSITGNESPYVLGVLTIIPPRAEYRTDYPDVAVFDDQHLVSFRATPSTLMPLDFPPAPIHDYVTGHTIAPVAADITVNEVGGNTLSGYISVSFLYHTASMAILMTGMHNLWTGYWQDPYGIVHQFWARSDKL